MSAHNSPRGINAEKNAVRIITPDRLPAEKGINYSIDHLRRLWKQGLFPRPIKIGPSRNGFIEEEIDAYLKSQADARRMPKTAV